MKLSTYYYYKIPELFKYHDKKSKYIFQEKFSFKQITVKYEENIIKNITNNTGSKQSRFTYLILTDCINRALFRGIYLQILRQFVKKMKLMIKKIIGQGLHYLYFNKSLKNVIFDHFCGYLKNS